MFIRKLLIIALTNYIMNFSYADTAGNTYWQEYSKAKKLYNQNKFSEALIVLEQLEQQQKNYNVELTLGDTYTALGYIQKGLNSHTSALEHGKQANNIVIQRVALFKIGKLQTLQKEYEAAAETYTVLLSMKLDKEDYAVANSGFKTAQEQINILATNLIKTGNQLAEKEEPTKALSNFQEAYRKALLTHNDDMQRIALFKIARTQLWLLNYNDAIKSYKHLLSTPLDKEDSNLANAGLKEAYELKKEALIKEARELINKNQGREAYTLIEPYLASQNLFELFIIAAQSMAILDNPNQSFIYFHKAYSTSNNLSERSIALLGMIKMQLSLNNRKNAEHYLFLLDRMTSAHKIPGVEQKKQEFIEQLNQLKIGTQIEQAQKYLESNNGKQVYDSIKWYLEAEKSPLLYLLAAESMAMINQPQFAFNYYQEAFNSTNKPKYKIIALFGMGKMQFWMARYVRAKNIYKELLHYNLSKKQRELALAGMVKSLSYYDRPRLAYSKIPPELVFTTPEMVIAASQASSWADWSDITKNILTQYSETLEQVNLQSGLGRDLKDLVWQTNLATWPNIITPSYYTSMDSETFSKSKTVIDYRHYWNQQSQTVLGPEYIKYSQDYFRAMDAKGFYIGQIIRPGRYLILDGKVEPMEYKNRTIGQRDNWSPILWNVAGSLTPNDYIKFKLLGQKEVLETFPAFNHRITNTLYGTNLTISPLPYVSLDGSYSHMDISDKNERNGYYFAPSLLINPDLGLTTMAIVRGFSNKFRSRDYFSPAQYQEKKVLVKLGRKLGPTWHYYLDGGFGRQYIKDLSDSETNSSPTYQWGMGINGPLSKVLFFTIYYVNTHQASAFIDSPGYAMQYGGISVNLLT
ncbi:hypothetical protein [uncultured Legionella sp.]|uniref:tetratricopeptide repeat protein n=1 Tax=uncultured Legionella sp. TaxID=210934 RepID=UPI00262A18EE|nr:hypothetical protein [uncultured Legionella sp.]